MFACPTTCDCLCHEDPEKHQLRTRIIDEGQREEFHQKHPNGNRYMYHCNRYMYHFHKSNRLKLETEWRSRWA